MAKDTVRDWDVTASNNTDIAGIGIQGTNAVSNFDGALRTLMAQVADVDGGVQPLNDTFTVCDPTDTTKRARIDAGNVSTATTRVLTMANENVDLAAMPANIAFRRGNILATVSQSGGVPTGALIERGSNANGEYVRFADGTMICTHNIDLTATAISTARGSLFGTAAAVTWTLPSTFTSVSSANANYYRNDLSFVGGSNPLSITNTVITFAVWNSSSNAAGNVKNLALEAIGRWF